MLTPARPRGSHPPTAPCMPVPEWAQWAEYMHASMYEHPSAGAPYQRAYEFLAPSEHHAYDILAHLGSCSQVQSVLVTW